MEKRRAVKNTDLEKEKGFGRVEHAEEDKMIRAAELTESAVCGGAGEARSRYGGAELGDASAAMAMWSSGRGKSLASQINLYTC